MVEVHRIYKSLPLDDFIDMTSFVFAKGGLLLTSLIQNFNYEKSYWTDKSEEELKEIFMEKAIQEKETDMAKENGISIEITNFKECSYYYVAVERKES